MNIMTANNTSSSSLSSSMSETFETSSILSSISSCCSHDTSNLDSNANNTSSSNNIQQTSLQFILNQNNDNPIDYWEFNDCNDYSEEEDEEYNNNNCYYYDSCYPDPHFSAQQFNSEYHQYTTQNYPNQYSSHGKLVPPPPSPPMEMDLLEDNQILSSDEFNSIFESFTAVVEGHSNNNNINSHNFIEDGCLKGVNCSNGFLDDEQLSKALDAIPMI